MTVLFYKTYWGIVGEAVVLEVQNFFDSAHLRTTFNHTFLALIPKTNNASKVDHYQPIALCNVILKIITKILASRLRKVLELIIHPCQSAFIPNRSINDNIIVNHEIMYYLNKKKGKRGFMAIKIDLVKAYDRVEWRVLLQIIRQFGFAEQFIKMVTAFIETPLFSIMINGAPFGYFKSSRDIRQGDPMSPGLFSIFSDLLSRILARAANEGKFSGIKISRYSPIVTHLMYADDLVIYCKADPSEVQALTDCLKLYGEWSGQEINWHKSSIHFSKNVSRKERAHLTGIMGIQECSHNGMYLGHPFCTFKSKNEAYKDTIEKLANKLSGWKQRTLSMAGRIVMQGGS